MDYEKIKFKSGLEIHQQLDTNKLFCNCPSVLRSDSPDFEISRKLHAVAGESGEVDVAAKYQAALGKEFTYQGYDTTCLVELDEEPPHTINQDALKVGLQVALLLNAEILPIAQVMRKTVVNGSNTSGFQRTVLFARDGYVETSHGKVRIDSICLEEDSARKISEEGNQVTFRLDRLGIPLIEIATYPDIKSADQAKEVALHLGEVLRSCKVKRGIGTIRQDVNISVKGENRVEMKGFQDMKMFVKTIENEVQRQMDLSEAGKPTDSEVRNALPDGGSEFIRPMPGADRMYPETDVPLLKISRDLINEVKKSLPKLLSVVEEELKSSGLSQEMIKLLLKKNEVDEFKDLLDLYNHPNFVAKMMLLFPKDFASKLDLNLGKVEETLNNVYGDVLIALNKKKIEEGDVKGVLLKIVEGVPLKDALKVEKADHGALEEVVMKVVKENPGLRPNAYMGMVMKEFGGKVDGKLVMQLIGKFAK